MYLHENNKELFKDLISITSERMHIREEIIEKDYYVTMILRLLANISDKIVFKGGTSLSKAFEIIDRFSEDVDITFTEHIGDSRRKRLKYEILKPIEEKLKMDIKNWAYIESNKNYNHYDYYYNSVLDNSMGGLTPYIKLETAFMSYSFPTEEKFISNYIYKVFAVDEPDIMNQKIFIRMTILIPHKILFLIVLVMK